MNKKKRGTNDISERDRFMIALGCLPWLLIVLVSGMALIQHYF